MTLYVHKRALINILFLLMLPLGMLGVVLHGVGQAGSSAYTHDYVATPNEVVFHAGWQLLEVGKGVVSFKARAEQEITICFSAALMSPGPGWNIPSAQSASGPVHNYRIHLAKNLFGDGVMWWIIQRDDGAQFAGVWRLRAGLQQPVSEFHDYWIIIDNGKIAVGNGKEIDRSKAVMSWADPAPLANITYVGFGGGDKSDVEFKDIRIATLDDLDPATHLLLEESSSVQEVSSIERPQAEEVVSAAAATGPAEEAEHLEDMTTAVSSGGATALKLPAASTNSIKSGSLPKSGAQSSSPQVAATTATAKGSARVKGDKITHVKRTSKAKTILSAQERAKLERQKEKFASQLKQLQKSYRQEKNKAKRKKLRKQINALKRKIKNIDIKLGVETSEAETAPKDLTEQHIKLIQQIKKLKKTRKKSRNKKQRARLDKKIQQKQQELAAIDALLSQSTGISSEDRLQLESEKEQLLYQKSILQTNLGHATTESQQKIFSEKLKDVNKRIKTLDARMGIAGKGITEDLASQRADLLGQKEILEKKLLGLKRRHARATTKSQKQKFAKKIKANQEKLEAINQQLAGVTSAAAGSSGITKGAVADTSSILKAAESEQAISIAVSEKAALTVGEHNALQRREKKLNNKVKKLRKQIAQAEPGAERNKLKRQLKKAQQELDDVHGQLSGAGAQGAGAAVGSDMTMQGAGLTTEQRNALQQREKKLNKKIKQLRKQIAQAEPGAERNKLKRQLKKAQQERDGVREQLSGSGVQGIGAAGQDVAGSEMTMQGAGVTTEQRNALQQREKKLNKKIKQLRKQIAQAEPGAERNKLKRQLKKAQQELDDVHGQLSGVGAVGKRVVDRIGSETARSGGALEQEQLRIQEHLKSLKQQLSNEVNPAQRRFLQQQITLAERNLADVTQRITQSKQSIAAGATGMTAAIAAELSDVEGIITAQERARLYQTDDLVAAAIIPPSDALTDMQRTTLTHVEQLDYIEDLLRYRFSVFSSERRRSTDADLRQELLQKIRFIRQRLKELRDEKTRVDAGI